MDQDHRSESSDASRDLFPPSTTDHDDFVVLPEKPCTNQDGGATPAHEVPCPTTASVADQLLQPPVSAPRFGSAWTPASIAALAVLAVLAMALQPNLILQPFAQRAAQEHATAALAAETASLRDELPTRALRTTRFWLVSIVRSR
jgi:hypothetical protein